MMVQGTRQSEPATPGGFTADAGVDDPIFGMCRRRPLSKKMDPSLFGLHTVSSADAVTENNDGLLLTING